MKTLKPLFVLLLVVLGFAATAQTATIKPDKNGKMNEFSEWIPLDVKGADGSTATIEYRMKLEKRMGVACHYIIEIKNNSTDKIDVVVQGVYYDKLVKGMLMDTFKGTLKPGKTFNAKSMAQGCKKDKGVETDDYGHCMNCDFEFRITATK